MAPICKKRRREKAAAEHVEFIVFIMKLNHVDFWQSYNPDAMDTNFHQAMTILREFARKNRMLLPLSHAPISSY